MRNGNGFPLSTKQRLVNVNVPKKLNILQTARKKKSNVIAYSLQINLGQVTRCGFETRVLTSSFSNRKRDPLCTYNIVFAVYTLDSIACRQE